MKLIKVVTFYFLQAENDTSVHRSIFSRFRCQSERCVPEPLLFIFEQIAGKPDIAIFPHSTRNTLSKNEKNFSILQKIFFCESLFVRMDFTLSTVVNLWNFKMKVDFYIFSYFDEFFRHFHFLNCYLNFPFVIIGGFPIENKTEIRYHIFCCYHNFIR